jgi:hypothetical protein
MKKYSLVKYFLPVIIIAIFNSSCKKYLDAGPITSTYGDKFWTSKTSVEQATAAMYQQLRGCFRDDGISYNSRSYFIFGDLTAGIFVSKDWNYASITQNGQWKFSYVPYLEGGLKNWSRFYQLIAQANLVLERVPAMPVSLFNNDPKIKNSYIAEALFMRAFTYFYITRVWGDPVYVNKTFNNVDYGNIPPVPRTPESTVLDSCITDLKKAAGYLVFPGGDPGKTIRANAGTVYALLAHIYAWKHDYVNAHSACQQVINNGGYNLETADNYTNIWAGQSSSESIFELPMTFNANGSEQNFDFFGTFLKDDYVDGKNSHCWVASNPYLTDSLFNSGNVDKRFKNILTHVNASGGDDDGYLLLKYGGFKYQTAATKFNPYINNDLVVFRLADIILLDAEAMAMQGNITGAVASLNVIKERAGIADYSGPTDQYSLVNEIFKERGRELIGEGQWFYDMIRTEPLIHGLEDLLGYSGDRVAQKGYYWPLDMSVLFKTDPALTQNPYWASH